MSRFVPWALVALCFALGVASRSISDSFVVFVPALQSAFDASRSAITVVYSFALLVGGTGAPLAGWIVDRFGLRALTVIGMSAAALATASASMATEVWHFYLSLGVVMGFAGASLSGVLSASLLGRWFPAHRLGVALAVAWSASGVGAMVMLPLAPSTSSLPTAGDMPTSSSPSSARRSSRCCWCCRGGASNAVRPASHACAPRPIPARPWARPCATGRSGRSPSRSA